MTKRILKWICIFPVTKPMAKWKRVARIVFVVLLVSFTIFAISAYYAFVVKNIKTDLEDALLTSMSLITCSGLVYMMLVAFFTRHRVSTIFHQLSIIYDDGKSTPPNPNSSMN